MVPLGIGFSPSLPAHEAWDKTLTKSLWVGLI